METKTDSALRGDLRLAGAEDGGESAPRLRRVAGDGVRRECDWFPSVGDAPVCDAQAGADRVLGSPFDQYAGVAAAWSGATVAIAGKSSIEGPVYSRKLCDIHDFVHPFIRMEDFGLSLVAISGEAVAH